MASVGGNKRVRPESGHDACNAIVLSEDDEQHEVPARGAVSRAAKRARGVKNTASSEPAACVDSGPAPAAAAAAAAREPDLSSGRVLLLNDVTSVAPGGAGVSLRRAVLGDTKDGVRRAIVSSYLTDPAYLFEAVPELASLGHDCVLLMHRRGVDPPVTDPVLASLGVRVLHPPLPRVYSCNHSKFFVLEFPHHLRVVVTSANLVQGDWERRTQSIWCQDFPRYDPALHADTARARPNDFADVLADYLACAGVPHDILQSMLTPWALVLARAYLITSVPGVHKGPHLRRYGHMRVRFLLEKVLRLATPQDADANLLFQCSSLGSISKPWLEALEASFLRASDANGAALPVRATTCQLVWPSVAFVRDSVDGYAAGMSIPCPVRNLKPLVTARMTPFTPRVERALVTPHIKTYTRITRDARLLYLVSGSHNVSQASWGALQVRDSQLDVSHFEISVLLVPESRDDPAWTLSRAPLPYQAAPGKLRAFSAHEQPWDWETPRIEPDSCGCVFPGRG